jgi:NAD(P)-dependent dehydrogenase (short-subunit alcohol dehydrogenase family)
MSSSSHLFIITGASRGLGRALAEQVLDRGHTLLTLARHPNDGLQQHADAHGAQLTQWPADLTDAAPAGKRLAEWLAQTPHAQLASATLINNAGMIPALAPLRDVTAGAIAQGIRLGLEATMILSAVFLGATRDWAGARRLLNISSGLGRHPMASQAVYCAAKAGMDLYTRCVALEEAQTPGGARVCALAPGVIDTDMQVQLRGADARQFPDRQRFADLKNKGALTSPADTARRILAYLERPDFGQNPVADIRDSAA